MGPPAVPSNERNKRKRVVEQESMVETMRRRRTVEIQDDDTDTDYDPDQNIEERRRIRKEIRQTHKSLLDNRSEFMKPESSGLKDTLMKANQLSEQVKQTADATIDSRLLVTAADYSLKKTVALISGDTAQGVDLDNFIVKCKAFMRRGNGQEDGHPHAPSSTQRRRRELDEEEEEDNDGDMLDWEYLGRYACMEHVSRPSIPGFLLGPLSLEKRARRTVVRKAPLRPNNIQETRPEVLQVGDIEKSENANLTNLAAQIYARLKKVQEHAMAAVEANTRDDMSEGEASKLMDKYGISPDGGIALFKFVINPRSFGQTIENMFYVSFLIRDGRVGIYVDERGLPYLGSCRC